MVLNKFNIFKGSKFRVISNDENKYLGITDLQGNIIPQSPYVWNPSGNCTNMTQINYNAFDNPVLSNNDGIIAIYAYRPAYEYVDNSKSTNIFY